MAHSRTLGHTCTACAPYPMSATDGKRRWMITYKVAGVVGSLAHCSVHVGAGSQKAGAVVSASSRTGGRWYNDDGSRDAAHANFRPPVQPGGGWSGVSSAPVGGGPRSPNGRGGVSRRYQWAGETGVRSEVASGEWIRTRRRIGSALGAIVQCGGCSLASLRHRLIMAAAVFLEQPVEAWMSADIIQEDAIARNPDASNTSLLPA
jgi:hypothetical protein